MTEWRIARESKELVGPITVTEDGVAQSSFELALLATGTRPAEEDWQAPDVVDEESYVLVGPGALELDPGSYVLWVRYSANPEIPVMSEGVIYIT